MTRVTKPWKREMDGRRGIYIVELRPSGIVNVRIKGQRVGYDVPISGVYLVGAKIKAAEGRP